MSDPSVEFHQLKALLNDSDVRADLQLADFQAKDLTHAIDALVSRSGDLIQRRHRVIVGEATEEEKIALKQDYLALLNEVRQRLSSSLLPHQVSRLEQINRQINELQTMGGTGFGVIELAEDLELDSEQQKKMKVVERETTAEYVDLLIKMREELIASRVGFRSRLLDVLNAEQRAKYDQLVGEELFRSVSLAPLLRSEYYLKRLKESVDR